MAYCIRVIWEHFDRIDTLYTYRHVVKTFSLTRCVGLGPVANWPVETFARYGAAIQRADYYRRRPAPFVAILPNHPWTGHTVQNAREGIPDQPLTPPYYPRWEVGTQQELEATPPPLVYTRLHGRWEPEPFAIYTDQVMDRFAQDVAEQKLCH